LSVEKLLRFERPRPSCRRFFVLSGRLQDKFDTHPFLIAGLAVWRVYKKKTYVSYLAPGRYRRLVLHRSRPEYAENRARANERTNNRRRQKTSDRVRYA
jgi:hypothetical protein